MGQQANRAAAQSPADQPGRDAQGRFTKGNRGGPGNPFARQVAALRKAFVGAVSEEQLRMICQRLAAQAMLGDVPSARVVLGYVLGKIPEPVNPDTLDQEECRQYLDDPTYAETEEMYQRRPPADLSAAMMRSFHIVQTEQARQILRHGPEATADEPEPSAPGGSEPTAPSGPDGPGSPEPRARRAEPAPSANGSDGVPVHGRRSTNGANGRTDETTGTASVPPSTNGGNGRAPDRPPSTNGENGLRRSRKQGNGAVTQR